MTKADDLFSFLNSYLILFKKSLQTFLKFYQIIWNKLKDTN